MPRYQTYGQYDEKTDEFPDNAEKVLRAGEDAASAAEPGLKDEKKDTGFYKKTESTAEEANKREGGVAGASGFYTGLNNAKGKSGGGGFMKRRGPLLAIIALIGGMAAGIGFSQVMMPFHVIESLTEMTDGSFTARQARMPNLVKWLFNMESGDYVSSASWPDRLGGTKYRYRRNIESSRVSKRLAAEGIDVDTDGGTTVLKYHQPDGTIRTVTADEYTELWRNDADFRNKMNRGGRSFLGRIAAHIDLTLANFLNTHSLTKNLFKDWINKVYEAEGQTARLHNTIERRKPITAGDTDTEIGEAKKGGGNSERYGEFDVDEDSQEKINVRSETDAEVKGKYADMIANVTRLTTGAVCGTAAVISAVTAARLVIAYENARGTFSGWAEGVDKVKAGMGDTSPINAIADEMMAKDENGLTALQSETMKTAISGATYVPNKNANDVVMNSQSAMLEGKGFWAEISQLLGGVTLSTKWVIGCAAANVATAAISIVADIATLGTFSFGKAILGIGAGLAIGLVADKMVSMLVDNAKSDFCLDKTGVMRGACVYLGSSNYNGLNFQNGGGTPATKEKAEGFYDVYKIALADEAELVRATKSPFDTSSSHTFLGSIMSKFSMLAVEMPSVASVVSSLANVASASFNSLLPTASALDKTSYFDNQLREDCANLDFGDFQALGDMNCEPWYITDQSMRSEDPEKTFAILRDAGQFEMDGGSLKIDENDNEIIKENSNLAKYISYCALRTSPFGMVDQNIMNTESEVVKSGSKVGNIIKKIISAIPILGDVFDAIESTRTVETMGWSTGANCIARDFEGNMSEMVVEGTDGSESSGSVILISWNEFMRYAQAYVADDRYMQTVDENYVSPVLTYIEKAGGNQPDSELSLVEYLAKYSGYTVENMQIALNELEYWTYIAQYEPEGKGPMKFDNEPFEVYEFIVPGREIYEDYNAQIAVISQRVAYADVRNRNVKMA